MSHAGHSAENCRPMLDEIKEKSGTILLIGDEKGQPEKVSRAHSISRMREDSQEIGFGDDADQPFLLDDWNSSNLLADH